MSIRTSPAGLRCLGVPPPAGMESAHPQPERARYTKFPGMGGVYVLMYEDERTAPDPRSALLEFARSAYEAIASLAGWDRGLLERRPPEIRRAA